MQDYLVLVAFDDGEIRRYHEFGSSIFEAIEETKNRLKGQYDLSTITGIQADPLGEPFFV